MQRYILFASLLATVFLYNSVSQVQAQGAQVISTHRAGDDFLVLSVKFHQTMGPHQISDTLGDAARNPWIRSVLSYGAGAAGVPPTLTLAALTVASRQTEGDRREERTYNLSYPEGWSFCRARADAISVNPLSGKRASVMAALAEPQQIKFTAWTPRKKVNQGRSWVEFDYRIVLIRSEKQTDAIAQKVCAKLGPILNCRGSGTDRPRCGRHEL